MVKLGELEVELDFPYPDLTSILTSALGQDEKIDC